MSDEKNGETAAVVGQKAVAGDAAAAAAVDKHISTAVAVAVAVGGCSCTRPKNKIAYHTPPLAAPAAPYASQSLPPCSLEL